ncbi:GIY-YIG nuclease family protein [Afipia carboxidovorans]|uniref:GIY-YIG nuclease family protein n=1 Tax=Afipia carboxidovorans TaxID=40137 RepID=UPI003090996F|nr:hypothetical protein CRBSH125_35160 [Afipia carboxidovorans]
MSSGTNYVYVFARDGERGLTSPVKVGISKDVVKRLSNIQTSSPFLVKIAYAFAVPDARIARDIERAFHETQKYKRAHGEWFDYEPVQAIHILCVCLRTALAANLGDDHALIDAALELSGVLAAEQRFNLAIPGRTAH